MPFFSHSSLSSHNACLTQFNIIAVFVLQSHVNVELKENEAKQRQLRGNYLCYGDSIQLRHTLTGKYICVSSSETSYTERSKLRVTKA